MDKKNKDLPPKEGNTRKKLFRIFGMVIGGGAFLVFVHWFFIGSKYVSTDNAYVGAEMVIITPAVAGIVKDIPVVDTHAIKKGAILVQIDDTDLKLALSRAEAENAKAQADYNRTKLIWNRRKALSSSTVSAEELSNAENNYKVAESLLLASKTNLEQSKINLERTVIRSPVDGVVARRQVHLGQHVAVGMNIMSIVPVQEMHVDANFKEVELRKIKVGQSVELTSDIYGSSVVYKGKVLGFAGGTGSVFATIPAQNATGNWIKVVQRLPVRIALEKDELEKNPLRVGLSMYAEVDLTSVP